MAGVEILANKFYASFSHWCLSFAAHYSQLLFVTVCFCFHVFLYSFLVLFLVSTFPFSVVFVFCRPLHPAYLLVFIFVFSFIFCLIYYYYVFPSHWCLSLVANHIRLLFVGVFSRPSSSIPTYLWDKLIHSA